MLIPRDLTHLDFGLRELNTGEASKAIGFIWKGTEVPWLICDTREGTMAIGTNPRIGARCVTLAIEGKDQRFICPKGNLRYRFTILRQQY